MVNILIIEDDKTMQFMLEEKLKLEGFNPIIAVNGFQGIDFFESGNIDLVITDIFMPQKDGIETILELKKRYPDVKIIAITGAYSKGSDISQNYLEMAAYFGAQKTLVKPFELKELVSAVNEVLSIDLQKEKLDIL